MNNLDRIKVMRANSQFTSKFYSIISEREKGNIFFSPLSIHAVLAMAYQGAAGNTANDFASTLNISTQKVAASGYSNVMATLNNLKNVTLRTANKIYVMKHFGLKKDFKKIITEQFLADTELIDFAESQKTANIINQWIESKTNAKIKNLVDPADLNYLTCLVLVNAVYFKGDWAHQFSKNSTRTEPFYIASEDKIDCQMMHITKHFNYCENEDLDAKILQMKYTNDTTSMVIVLPNDKDGVADLEKKLENVDLLSLTHHMRRAEVEVSLPKFKIETTIDLEPILTKMGLGVIFSDEADFSEISEVADRVRVSKAVQKTYLEVNEEGTIASAGLPMFLCSIWDLVDHIQFKADHPFILLLQTRCGDINYILFYGKIGNPQYN